MEIRPLREHELPQALALVWRVFLEFEAPEYPAEGVEEFRRSIADPAYLSQLRCYGAFAQDTLLGVMATRCAGSHVALFFVDAAHIILASGKRSLRVHERIVHRAHDGERAPYASRV